MTDEDTTTGLRRRDALLALGGLGLGLGGLAGYEATTGAGDAAAADCVLAKEVTEGPYWVPTSITRRDVTGVPLALHHRGRTPHIHVKVHVGGQVVHTGQLFFSDKVSAAVYRTSAYRSRGQADTTNSQDGIYAQNGRAQLRLAKRAAGKGYRGSMSLGVHR